MVIKLTDLVLILILENNKYSSDRIEYVETSYQ